VIEQRLADIRKPGCRCALEARVLEELCCSDAAWSAGESFDGLDLLALARRHTSTSSARPSMITLHAPQSPVRHPSLLPVIPSTSRRPRAGSGAARRGIPSVTVDCRFLLFYDHRRYLRLSVEFLRRLFDKRNDTHACGRYALRARSAAICSVRLVSTHKWRGTRPCRACRRSASSARLRACTRGRSPRRRAFAGERLGRLGREQRRRRYRAQVIRAALPCRVQLQP